jgi:hypothetical protein
MMNLREGGDVDGSDGGLILGNGLKYAWRAEEIINNLS